MGVAARDTVDAVEGRFSEAPMRIAPPNAGAGGGGGGSGWDCGGSNEEIPSIASPHV
jgi:hypothetical protein